MTFLLTVVVMRTWRRVILVYIDEEKSFRGGICKYAVIDIILLVWSNAQHLFLPDSCTRM